MLVYAPKKGIPITRVRAEIGLYCLQECAPRKPRFKGIDDAAGWSILGSKRLLKNQNLPRFLIDVSDVAHRLLKGSGYVFCRV
jgi:hypothetical protein